MTVKVLVQYDDPSERDDAMACAAGLAMRHKYGVTIVQRADMSDYVVTAPATDADIERRLKDLEDKVRAARNRV